MHSPVQEPTAKQALAAAKALAADRKLGVHDRCTADLRLLGLGKAEAVALVEHATMANVNKSEWDNTGRPMWALELCIPHPDSPTGFLYVKPVLHMPLLKTGYILSFKPCTDDHA